ncbi:hypothetical protein Tco_0971068 [Tanacetum coccineum]
MSLSLAENVIVAGADNRPPMLDKTQYSSWASRMLLYIKESKLLIQGSELSLQERESKLYDEFNTFTSTHGESIHSYYLRFLKLINDMHTIGMKMQPLQVNTKFVNHLQLKRSKSATDVKLARDTYSTSFDHLYAYLRQHEAYGNEYYPQHSLLAQKYYSSPASQWSYDVHMVQQSSYQPQVANPSPMVHHQPYQAPAIHQQAQASFPQLDLGLTVPSFLPSDDLISSLNKAMAYQ